jgi:hypothetical protein
LFERQLDRLNPHAAPGSGHRCPKNGDRPLFSENCGLSPFFRFFRKIVVCPRFFVPPDYTVKDVMAKLYRKPGPKTP